MSLKRIIAGYIVIVATLFFCILRVSSIVLTPKYLEYANKMTTKTIFISNIRGAIYDCNRNKLTNNVEKYVSLITDNPTALNIINEYFDVQETKEITNEIKNNKFAIRITDNPINCEGVISIAFNSRIAGTSIAKHIIGYLDEENRGVSGIELAFDDILFSDEKINLNVGIDGQGNVLLGSVKLENLSLTNGVVTTIDSDIQTIVEGASNSIKSGAVVVVDITNGKVKAMVSRPDFNPEKLGEYIYDNTSPLINRALLNFNVGSVFKLCVAAAGLENGYNNFSYNCRGIDNIDGLSFRCHNPSGHGRITMAEAIKHSCNTYFYNFAINLGADKIYSIANKAGFKSKIVLADGLSSAKGNMANLNEVKISKRAIANLAIGQGELLLSPLSLTNLYCAIANNGEYYPPTIYEGKIINNEFINDDEKTTPIKLMSSSTANTLKNYLKGVLDEDGTGYNANPKIITAAGKTATAQTGVVYNGKSVTNTWFCGFFPFENPKYVVTVFSENTEESCAGVFAEIADKMYSQ